MRQLPILFSTPMVQAIQENRKTMTRRTAGLEKVNINPDDFKIMNLFYMPDGTTGMVQFDHKGLGFVYAKPRYQVGDQLYVKETFCLDLLGRLVYRAKDGDTDGVGRKFKWISSLFMKKEYARLWLEVTEVRCERLKDITEADAIAEGIETLNVQKGIGYKNYTKINVPYWLSPQSSFFSLWILINGLDSLNSNPWLFVYRFKRIPKP